MQRVLNNYLAQLLLCETHDIFMCNGQVIGKRRYCLQLFIFVFLGSAQIARI